MLFVKTRFLLAICTIFIVSACKNDPAPVTPQGVYVPPAPMLEYTKTATVPHDVNAFTEGLLFHNGQLYESTGSPESMANVESFIGITDLKTGKIAIKTKLDPKYFGEGIVIFNNRIYQLTWKDKVGFVYDLKSFKKLREFTIPTREGWGMTTDSTHIIMSDGSANLTYLDPESLTIVKTLGVTDNGMAMANLNELEYIHGFIYANIWGTNTIVKIDPSSGKVVGRLDFSALAQEIMTANPNASEMNGIAWNPATDKIYVTGKMWQSMFEINFEH